MPATKKAEKKKFKASSPEMQAALNDPQYKAKAKALAEKLMAARTVDEKAREPRGEESEQ